MIAFSICKARNCSPKLEFGQTLLLSVIGVRILFLWHDSLQEFIGKVIPELPKVIEESQVFKLIPTDYKDKNSLRLLWKNVGMQESKYCKTVLWETSESVGILKIRQKARQEFTSRMAHISYKGHSRLTSNLDEHYEGSNLYIIK